MNKKLYLALCFAIVLSCCVPSHRQESTLEGTWLDEPPPVLTGQDLEIAAQLYQFPTEMPRFVAELVPAPGASMQALDEICVYLDIEAVWEAGDTAATFDEDAKSAVELFLNGRQITALQHGGRPYSLKDHVSFRAILVSPPGMLGTFGVCFRAHLKSGFSLMTVRFATSAGKKLSYSWVFKVS